MKFRCFTYYPSINLRCLLCIAYAPRLRRCGARLSEPLYFRICLLVIALTQFLEITETVNVLVAMILALVCVLCVVPFFCIDDSYLFKKYSGSFGFDIVPIA